MALGTFGTVTKLTGAEMITSAQAKVVVLMSVQCNTRASKVTYEWHSIRGDGATHLKQQWLNLYSGGNGAVCSIPLSPTSRQSGPH